MTYTAKWTGKAVSANRRLAPGRGGRLYRTADYTAFLKSLAVTFQAAKMLQGWETTRDDVAVEIRAWLPAQMDGEAVQKPVLDALQLAGVVENDRQCRDVRVRHMGTGAVSRIEIVLKPLTDGGVV
jgi:Holliday junction resolvase RusA-like endonuclease